MSCWATSSCAACEARTSARCAHKRRLPLLLNCHLDAEQRTQLAMKRAGTQPFQEVADLLRTLDRPEAFREEHMHSLSAVPLSRCLVDTLQPLGCRGRWSLEKLSHFHQVMGERTADLRLSYLGQTAQEKGV